MRHSIWSLHPLAFRTMVLGLAVLAALLASGGVSSASASTHVTSLGSAPLIRLHCEHPTARTLQIMKQFQQTIQKYHLCQGAKGTQSSTTASPANEVTGDCGTASLWLFWTGVNGQTRFDERLQSFEGNMLQISYTVDWNNNDAKTAGIIHDDLWFRGTVWANSDYRATGAGKTSGVMEGTVITLEDLCAIGYPSDFDIHP